MVKKSIGNALMKAAITEVIQEQKDHFHVKVVKDSRFSEKTVEEIKKRMRESLGDIRAEVQLVKEIHPEKSWKFKPFISLCRGNGSSKYN